MGDSPRVRERITKTVEVVIPLPCDWKTFGYWLHRVESTLEQRLGRKAAFDDDFTFTSDGDELVASFDVTEVKP